MTLHEVHPDAIPRSLHLGLEMSIALTSYIGHSAVVIIKVLGYYVNGRATNEPGNRCIC